QLLVLLFWLMAGATVACGIWQLFRPKAGTPEEQKSLAQNQQRVVGLALLGIGAVVALVGLWLTFTKGLGGLGESIGLVALGVLGLGVGGRLVSPPQTATFHDRLLQGLIQNRAPASVALIAAGALFIIIGAYVRFSVTVGDAKSADADKKQVEDRDKDKGKE